MNNPYLAHEASRFDAYSKPCLQSTRKSFVSSSMPPIPSTDWSNTASSFVANQALQQNPSRLQVAMDNVSTDPSDPRATREALAAISVTTAAMLKGKTDYQTVQDIAQEAALQVLLQAANGHPVNASYARRCITGHFKMFVEKALCKKRGSGEVNSYGDIPESINDSDDTFDELINAELQEKLNIHIAELPEQVGKAVTMRFLDQLTFQAVADSLGCSKAQAHNLTQQGISLLQQAMA